MAEIHTSHLVVDGVRCFVRQSGPIKDKEAVVFVHGNPGSSEDFGDLLTHTGEFVRSIAPDMPGFGKAERPTAKVFGYNIEGYARYLTGLLEQLSVERVHLVVHDFGGLWGLQFAANHLSRIASLTLIDVGVLPGYRWHKYARIWRTPVLGELAQLTAARKAFGAALNADNPKPLPDSFLDRMFEDADWGQKLAALRLYRASHDLGAVTQLQAAALKSGNLPALVLWGEGDKYVPARFALIQQQYFQAEVHVLPGVGHWPMIDAPETVAHLVVTFLRKQLGLSGSLISVGA